MTMYRMVFKVKSTTIEFRFKDWYGLKEFLTDWVTYMVGKRVAIEIEAVSNE